MLHRLTIRNYAIIDRLEIDFNERMNIITGETGAGKSILIGALNLILGQRADSKVLYDVNEKCIVEADFELHSKSFKDFFAHNELDFDTHTIIRREINQNGKSRAFVNDSPVNLQQLKLLGERLVNMHSQHETLDLTEAGFQLQVVDLIAHNSSTLVDYKTQYQLYRQNLSKLNELIALQKSSAAEQDFIRFQLNELTEADLNQGEQEQLEQEQNTLTNIEEIKIALQNASQVLDANEPSVVDYIGEIISQFKNIKGYSTELNTLDGRLHSVYEEVKDIARDIDNLNENTAIDPERLEDVNNRLNAIYRLMKKHHATSVSDLITLRDELEAKVHSVEHSDIAIQELKSVTEAQLQQLLVLAEQLHNRRNSVIHDLEKNITLQLTKVGMPGAQFVVEITKLNADSLTETGLTDVHFLFSANKGFPPLEIKQVASGGELSRLMLCIKSLIADAGELPTMIFDEIDSGISGEVALKVGEIMKELSKKHQLICITHLPQIARTADLHLYIFKEEKLNRTFTRIKPLEGEDRVVEIAKMLSGEKVSDVAMANARELIAG
ncbi:MAG: DNA repair protein RecN [Chitinophagales bacterium]|nr:DNA repair protein RecN [Chitinophagales bacterium]